MSYIGSGDRSLSGSRLTHSPVTAFTVLIVASFLAGILIAALTAAVEKAGIQGEGWSLRGNGALIVPACGLPVILVVGSALLARRLGAGRRSYLLGLGAGIMALSLSAILAAYSSPALFPLLLLVAFGLALLLARIERGQGAVGLMMAASLAVPVSTYAGLRAWASLFSSP